MSLIVRAATLADSLHKGQTRKYNGHPYIEHPGRVAARIARMGMEEEVVAAAWLHDVVEDCNVSLWDLKQHGIPLATCLLVNELTNPSKKLPNLNRTARKEIDRTHAGQISELGRSIKLADRIDNLREMDVVQDSGFAKIYVLESIELLGVLVDTNKELETELRDVCHSLTKAIEKHHDAMTAPVLHALAGDYTLSKWLNGALGGGSEMLNANNPDHYSVVVDLLPLMEIAGGSWKAVSDRVKRHSAAKAAAQTA